VLGLTWIRGAVLRRPGRVAAEALGIAVAVALIVALALFLVNAKQTMTQRSIEQVAVDWQVAVTPGADAAALLDATRAQPHVTGAVEVDFAATAGMTAQTSGTTQTTGPGVAVGLPSGYENLFPGAIRPLAGTTQGALLTQQAAANLHAVPGTVVTIARAGLPDAPVTIVGIVDLPQADSFFQVVGATANAPQAPPDNVILVPRADWQSLFSPLDAARPDLIHRQIHAQLDRRWPDDPAAAFAAVGAAARNLEVRSAGAATVGDNIGAALDTARSDALYAKLMFLFLGLPGAALALVVAATIAATGREHRRVHAGLLRTRGASPRTLVWLSGLEALCIGTLAAVVGVIAGVAATRAAATGPLGASAHHLSPALLGVVVTLAVGVAAVTIAGPVWRDTRRSTFAASRTRTRESPPFRLLVPVGATLLAVSAVVFNSTSAQGYNLVLVPEGFTAISVSYWAFLGPALLWVGAALLTAALAAALLSVARHRWAATAIRPLAGTLSPAVLATMRRQRRLLARGVALVALTAAFAVSTAAFNETYRQQSTVDALLTNGADVTVRSTARDGLDPNLAARVTSIAGVSHVEPLIHRFAYVGNDLQDLYGVNPSTIVTATKLQDSYFAGGTARDLMNTLAREPDGVMVSTETVRDFQLHPGDRMTLRLNRASGGAVPVTFRFVGVVAEFPTAPRDSFLVANAAYVQKETSDASSDTLLVETGGRHTTAIADQIRTLTGTAATVTDLDTTRAVVGSSLTAVDLAGLSRIELGFGLLLTVVTTGLMLALGVDERRRTFAIASSLGARARHVGAFVWSESAYITVLGFAVGAVLAWMLTNMLVAVLTGVFDPPPETPAVPWSYIGAVLATAIVAVAVACVVALRSARQDPSSALRAPT
jgi:putative ABC transport system permease protein